ncbi:hypothetical protein TSAR_008692, partial [Trichomalopsis sarcophagae]
EPPEKERDGRINGGSSIGATLKRGLSLPLFARWRLSSIRSSNCELL